MYPCKKNAIFQTRADRREQAMVYLLHSVVSLSSLHTILSTRVVGGKGGLLNVGVCVGGTSLHLTPTTTTLVHTLPDKGRERGREERRSKLSPHTHTHIPIHTHYNISSHQDPNPSSVTISLSSLLLHLPPLHLPRHVPLSTHPTILHGSSLP